MAEVARPRGRPSTGVREAVLAATEAILAEVGVARLSTTEIAKRAGVAESSIFYHFRDRLGLLEAVVQKHLPMYKDVSADMYRRAGEGTVRGNLVDLLTSLEGFYERIAPIYAAVQADGDLRARFAERGGEGEIGPHRGLIPIVRYLERERELGRVRADLDLESTALILVGVAYQRAVLGSLAGRGRVEGLPAVVDTLLPSLLPA
ncbi:TetR/AcrR family transcriptional regulator [Pseudonocardia sp. TRM90224]|uniref:TetR/AcrR family transcriptional regulator n=1 Tax=Pseudonocardia sp. TRM90224 TaxID=2812678 RepID=UPI001E5064FC|nr:TetR/AcrR family transcriptional regulator [Pseudonocardia sp. TRM90224]